MSPGVRYFPKVILHRPCCGRKHGRPRGPHCHPSCLSELLLRAGLRLGVFQSLRHGWRLGQCRDLVFGASRKAVAEQNSLAAFLLAQRSHKALLSHKLAKLDIPRMREIPASVNRRDSAHQRNKVGNVRMGNLRGPPHVCWRYLLHLA